MSAASPKAVSTSPAGLAAESLACHGRLMLPDGVFVKPLGSCSAMTAG